MSNLPSRPLPPRRRSVGKIVAFSLLGLVGVVLAVGVGAFIWVQNADLRGILISQIKDRTGMEIQATGPFTVKLWPVPVLSIEGLSVPALQGGGTLFAADSITVRASWGGFPRFWNGIALDEFTVINPVADLRVAANGTKNWMPAVAADTDPDENQKPEAADIPTELPISRLGVINIDNLNLTYTDAATGRKVTAKNVTLKADGTALNNTAATLTGNINGHQLSGNVKTDLSNLKTLPLTASVAAANLQASVEGTADINNSAFSGTAKAESPNLKASLDSLLGKAPEGTPAAPLNVNLSMMVGAESLDVQEFKASLGDILQADGSNVRATWGDDVAASGTLQARGSNLRAIGNLAGLKQPLPAAAFTLNTTLGGKDEIKLTNTTLTIANLLNAQGNLTLKPESGELPGVEGQLALGGPNLKALAQGFGVAADVPAAPFRATSSIKGQGTYRLPDFKFELQGLATANADVTIAMPTGALTGQPPKIDAKLNLSSPNTAALAKAFGVAQALPAKPLTLKTTVSGQNSYSIEDLEAAITGVLKATADVDVTPGTQPGYKGNVSIKGDNLAAAASQFGVAAKGLPSSAFSVTSDVTGQGAISLPNLKVDLPGLAAATGNIRFAPGTPNNLTATLDVTRLNLDALGYCSAPPTGKTSAEPTTAKPAAATDQAPWTDDPIATDALKSIAFTIKANVNGITCARAPVKSLAANLSNTTSKLTIEQFDAVIGEGSLKLKGNLNHSGTPALSLNVVGDKLAIEQFVPAMAERGLVLPLNVSANLTSRGNSTRALAQNLNGDLKANATSGKLPYTQFLGQASALQSLLKGGAAPATNSSGKLDELVADYAVANGLVSTQKLAISTDGGAFKLTGTGTVNLPLWTIDYTLKPVAAVGKDLTVPVLIKGPLTSPAIGADPSFVKDLTGRLASEGLQSLLGKDKEETKALGGVVGGILSGQGVNKEDLGGAINQFFGPKKSATPAAAPAETPAATPAAEAAPAAETPAPAAETTSPAAP